MGDRMSVYNWQIALVNDISAKCCMICWCCVTHWVFSVLHERRWNWLHLLVYASQSWSAHPVSRGNHWKRLNTQILQISKFSIGTSTCVYIPGDKVTLSMTQPITGPMTAEVMTRAAVNVGDDTNIMLHSPQACPGALCPAWWERLGKYPDRALSHRWCSVQRVKQ